MRDETCETCLYVTACPLSGLRVCRHYKPVIDVAVMTIKGKLFVKPILRDR